MLYNGREVEFPAIVQVSFYKVFEVLEEQTKSKDEAAAVYAQALLKEADLYPELKEGISNLDQIGKYESSIKRLSKTIFPDALTTNEIKFLVPPFYFEPLYSSARFDKIVEASGEPFNFSLKGVDGDTFYLYGCYFILSDYYHFSLPGRSPRLLEFFNKHQGLMRTYKMMVNAELCRFVPTDKAVDITQADYEELIENFGDLELWKKKFPPNSWIIQGLNIANLVDVTFDQSMGSISSNLLIKSTDTFENIQQGLRRILNNHDLSIGILKLENDELTPFGKENVPSIILNMDEPLSVESGLCDHAKSQLLGDSKPLVITDVNVLHENTPSRLSQKIKMANFQSFIITPILHEGELLGFLELGAKVRLELNKGSLNVLVDLMPILGIAHKRILTEAQNLIEAVIQQECTTIHTSVKWRFEEEAEEFVEARNRGDQQVFKDITFDNLYPLYGQMDIKGSSERRNRAVKADLTKQLKSAKLILDAALSRSELPVHEEVKFRCESYIKELDKELVAGIEHRIVSFLSNDVYPVFERIKAGDSEMKTLVSDYTEMIDPEVNTIYDERKKYDQGVNLINQRLAGYLDKSQVEAQAMFPHYFERYKTDGVEHNIYIGQSISPELEFDAICLKNIRLWQLKTMCEMEREFREIQQGLDISIEIASLVLVYNTPISVQFRMDEKQFDVKGAYNARYEIIKKRVDKAHIKGTDERITRPGSLVIVYSQEQDAMEYRTYLNYLIAKGYLKEEYEDLALENLQGVHGLHALRAELAYAKC